MVTMTVQDAPVTVEATLNYLLDTGVMPSVYTGGPGSTIVRAASPSDQRRVTMHNGRLQAGGFVLDREGFRFVGHGTKPAPLDDVDVKRILKQMKMEAPKVKVSFSQGERVKVVDGPFTDFIGVVDSINAERGKVRVLVSFFGRETPVELDFLQVSRIT